MPPGYRADDPRFSGDWYCDMNPNREMAAYGCDAPQEVDEVTIGTATCTASVCVQDSHGLRACLHLYCSAIM
jgi:hypothetical protein